MNSNYPPGVSGHEPQIVGAPERQVEGSFICDACDQEVHAKFTVTLDFEWYGEWVCPECGHSNSYHEDETEDPDREIGAH